MYETWFLSWFCLNMQIVERFCCQWWQISWSITWKGRKTWKHAVSCSATSWKFFTEKMWLVTFTEKMFLILQLFGTDMKEHVVKIEGKEHCDMQYMGNYLSNPQFIRFVWNRGYKHLSCLYCWGILPEEGVADLLSAANVDIGQWYSIAATSSILGSIWVYKVSYSDRSFHWKNSLLRYRLNSNYWSTLSCVTEW